MGDIARTLGLGGGNGQTAAPLSSIAGDPSSINVEGFQPTHRNFLGKLGDALLMMNGNDPVYEGRMRDKDMQKAMEGFSHDPLTAIQRLAQIPGMGSKALDMYNDYTRIHQNDEMDKLRMQYYKDKNVNVVRNMLGAVASSKDPAGQYVKLYPTIKNYADARGLDISGLPETYDADRVNAFRLGGIDVDQQERMSQQADLQGQRLDMARQRMEQSAGNAEDRLDIARQRLELQAQRNEVLRTQGQERLDMMKSKGESQYVNTKYGPGEVSSSGNTLTVKRGNIVHIYANTGPNTWRHVDAMKLDSNGKLVPLDNDEE